jgi:predicted Zn finger-like uncharacterized protein
MPIQVVCESCQAAYNLNDDLAGRKLRCKQCQSVILVPEAEYELTDHDVERVDRGYHPAFDRDRFFVNQKRLSINEKYYVFDEARQPILFIERKAHLGRQLLMLVAGIGAFLAVMFALFALSALLARAASFEGGGPIGVALAVVTLLASFAAMMATAIALAPRRHIDVYTDKDRSERLLEVLQDQKFSLIRATYTVRTPEGATLGSFMKNYLYNFFRKRWYVRDAAGRDVLMAKEDSIILALLRRVLGPFFGLLITNFIVVPMDSDRVIGEFNRKFTLFDRYVLDLTADVEHRLDRRMAVALAVLLDTGERR